MHLLLLLHLIENQLFQLEMALAHPRKNGATIFGINSKKNLIVNGQLGLMELQ